MFDGEPSETSARTAEFWRRTRKGERELLYETAFVLSGHRECVCFRKKKIKGLQVNKYTGVRMRREFPWKRSGKVESPRRLEACSPRRHFSFFLFFFLFLVSTFDLMIFYLSAASVKIAPHLLLRQFDIYKIQKPL